MSPPLLWKSDRSAAVHHDLGKTLAERDGVRHNLIASLLLRAEEGRSVFVRGDSAEEVAFDSGQNLVINHLEYDGLLSLAHQFEGSELPGVVGPLDSAEGFVEAYAAVVGIRPRKWINQGLYRCDQLRVPSLPEGFARPVRLEDQNWLTQALSDFIDEAIPHDRFLRANFEADFPAMVSSEPRFFVWEFSGEPRAFAALSGVTPSSRRIGPVHTLAAERARGYGSALTAHLTTIIHQSGRVPCLYTDLANATSNSIYRKLGFTLEMRGLHAVYHDRSEEFVANPARAR